LAQRLEERAGRAQILMIETDDGHGGRTAEGSGAAVILARRARRARRSRVKPRVARGRGACARRSD
ncbi:hypothetical protein AAHH79_41630, partial [Burkholderia pseudomallei]